nr:MAG TPA: hypothetical protein [Bacteriophage sp.]
MLRVIGARVISKKYTYYVQMKRNMYEVKIRTYSLLFTQ